MPHIHELIDFVANVLIVCNNKVLLINHKKLKMWLPIGGHIELNEDPEQALFREVREECGLEIEILTEKPKVVSKVKFLYAPVFLDIHNVSDAHKHVALTYFAKAKSDKVTLNKEEHNDIKWFSLEDLEKPEFDLEPAIKFYAKEALKVLKDVS